MEEDARAAADGHKPTQAFLLGQLRLERDVLTARVAMLEQCTATLEDERMELTKRVTARDRRIAKLRFAISIPFLVTLPLSRLCVCKGGNNRAQPRPLMCCVLVLLASSLRASTSPTTMTTMTTTTTAAATVAADNLDSLRLVLSHVHFFFGLDLIPHLDRNLKNIDHELSDKLQHHPSIMSSHSLEGVVNASFKKYLQYHKRAKDGIWATMAAWGAQAKISGASDLPDTALPQPQGATDYGRFALLPVAKVAQELVNWVHATEMATADQMPSVVTTQRSKKRLKEEIRLPALARFFGKDVRGAWFFRGFL